jgi:hypothetical protein
MYHRGFCLENGDKDIEIRAIEPWIPAMICDPAFTAERRQRHRNAVSQNIHGEDLFLLQKEWCGKMKRSRRAGRYGTHEYLKIMKR